MANGIDLILADHQRVSELFTRFADERCGGVIGEVVDALAAHDDAEHAALYPMVGQLVGNDEMIRRSMAAHSMVKRQIDHLKALEGDPLTAAFEVLRQLVTDHVADEEKNILPALAASATPQQLDALGARILQAKQRGG